ncbi:MAG: 50S ribosomal protein L21 [Parcubacteria group bacterium GW2011_GWA2_38_13]|nr:MAG: 50S ribosomal protein L21 [Parcubacteria group bacterium GW2011_GWA2_38_13]
MPIAVIKTGGKQYVVTAGKNLQIEKIEGNVGDKVVFETMLISDEKGENVEIGKPVLDNRVEGKIIKQARDRKIDIIKFKSKVRYKRINGHRQHHTQVEITKI